MRFKIASAVAACLLLAAAAAVGAPAVPAQPAPPAPAPTPAPAAVAPAAAPTQGGMIIGRDPVTGELGLPSAEQRRELAAKEMGAAALAGKALFEVALPGVGFKIDLQGLLQDYAVASIGPDGQPRLSCLHEQSEVERFLAEGAAAPVAPVAPAAPGQWEVK